MDKIENEEMKQQADAQPETPAAEAPKANESKSTKKDKKKRHDHEVEELTLKVEELGAKLQEMNDKYQRVYAEYENYRKRTSAEKAELILNGGKDVIKSMLAVLDDMERALDNLADDDAAKEGMMLVYKNMLKPLEQRGLKAMDAKGAKFDENYHEAITQIPAPTPEVKGTVIDVVKKGYFLHDDVLRFAQVVVAC
ncbi:MAG: nucleotide exchange factor GrpE [Bacteroidales bacterium]|nr:nucleotide exchange factor GrpE [Bacteroidales bacterium]